MALEDGNTIIIVSGSNVAPEHSVVLRKEDLAKALNEKENLGEGSGKTNSEHANNEFSIISEMGSQTMDYQGRKIRVSEIKDDLDGEYPTSNCDSLLPWLLERTIKKLNPGITDEDAKAAAEIRCKEIAKIKEKHKKYSRCVPYIERISRIRIEKTSGIPDKVVVRDKSKKGKKQSD